MGGRASVLRGAEKYSRDNDFATVNKWFFRRAITASHFNHIRKRRKTMFCKRPVMFLSLALTLFFLDGRISNACSCGPKPTVLESYKRANFVVIVQVVSVEKAQDSARAVDGVRSTSVIVERVFKGALKTGEEMTFTQGGGGDCIWTFNAKDVGERFLFYLSAKGKSERFWLAGYCGRSSNAEYAADDLLYLENMAKAVGRTRLSGTLRFSQASPVEDQEPIDNSLHGKTVTIVGAKKTYELTTNRDGVYEVYDLAAGKYLIYPEVPDGLKIEYQRGSSGRGELEEKKDDSTPKKPVFQVIVEAGQHAYFDFGYRVNNAIRGRVLDPSGNAMKDVCVSVAPAHGKPAKYFSITDCTDKDGAFELIAIPFGAYVIAINKDGQISSNEPFPTFYYPGVVERDRAVVINIGPGQILEQINIFAPIIEETITVEGICLYSDGRPVVEGSIKFEPEKTGGGIDGKARAQTDPSGRFAIKILKGLSGTLYGETHAYSGQYENCPELEELLKKAPSLVANLRTNVVAIRAADVVPDVELKYAFRGCKKAK